MQEESKSPRYLCSDLLRISGIGSWSGWANLEEIWDRGAILESDIPIKTGEKLLLTKDGGKIWGQVQLCAEHPFGYRIHLDFLFDQKWSTDLFRPEHLFDPNQMLSNKAPLPENIG